MHNREEMHRLKDLIDACTSLEDAIYLDRRMSERPDASLPAVQALRVHLENRFLNRVFVSLTYAFALLGDTQGLSSEGEGDIPLHAILKNPLVMEAVRRVDAGAGVVDPAGGDEAAIDMILRSHDFSAEGQAILQKQINRAVGPVAPEGVIYALSLLAASANQAFVGRGALLEKVGHIKAGTWSPLVERDIAQRTTEKLIATMDAMQERLSGETDGPITLAEISNKIEVNRLLSSL